MTLMNLKLIRRIASIAIALALFVVMLGAYTRLTDAGLGCPDWPGCYGRLVLPSGQSDLSTAQQAYPLIQLEAGKAWTEMFHRYAAGSLGLLILMIFIVSASSRPRLCAGVESFWARLRKKITTIKLPLILMGLVIFQALLGMWTVTLKLLPVVVMAHLLGGILIFSCLCYLRLQVSHIVGESLPQWRFWIGLGTALLLMQIALGGWVSSNYAGIACVGFPTCNGQWFPPLYFSEGFNLFSPVGMNYQGGLLENHIRISIQYVHRIGALVSTAYILTLSTAILLRQRAFYLRIAAMMAMVLILIQFALGIVNVTYILPLWSAVAHNGVAAVLFATLLSMLYLSKGEAQHASQN